MDWKEIEISEDGTFFEHKGIRLFNKQFTEALKYHPPGIAPAKDESGSYHINSTGQPVYPQRYTRTFGFYCDRAAVIQKDKWFHVNTVGERIYEQFYAWAGNYQQDLCTVRDFSGSYFHIDKSGQRVYKENFAYAGDFYEGYACVRGQDGLYLHIRKDGTPLNGKRYRDLGVFHKGFAAAKDSHGWFHINKHGVELYPQRYQAIEPFYNGFALVADFSFKKIILSESGEELMEV